MSNDAQTKPDDQRNFVVINGNKKKNIAGRTMLLPSVRQSIERQRFHLKKSTRRTAGSIRLPERVVDDVVVEAYWSAIERSYRHGYGDCLAGRPPVSQKQVAA